MTDFLLYMTIANSLMIFFLWIDTDHTNRYRKKLNKLKYEIEREELIRQLMFERELTNQKVIDPTIKHQGAKEV